jgi:hypothetical protein
MDLFVFAYFMFSLNGAFPTLPQGEYVVKRLLKLTFNNTQNRTRESRNHDIPAPSSSGFLFFDNP